MEWVNFFRQGLARKINKISVSLGRLVLGTLLLAVAHHAYAFPGTLNFSGSDAFIGTTVNDGDANSTDIPVVVIEIYTANLGGNANQGAPWEYLSDYAANGPGDVDDGIADSSGDGGPSVIIRTQGGEYFSFSGIDVLNYVGAHGSLKFEGFRDGVSTGSETLGLDGGDFHDTFTQGNGLTAAKFQYVDEIRITDPISSEVYVAIDTLVFAAPVLPTPTITSADYDASNGALAIIGTNFTASGSDDVIANKFTLTGEGGSTYTLTDTSNVEIGSATGFTLTLSATDRAAVNLILNKNGVASTNTTDYNLAGAAGFIAADPAIEDLLGNGITVSNTASPTVTSATYNANTGVLVVTGANLKSASGATNDIVANKFTLTGEGGSTYTLTDTANVEVTSGTSFTMTLSATDRAATNLIMNQNGPLSTDISTYILSAAEDWNAGADAALTIADTSGNGITVSNVAIPAITSATYNASTGVLVVTGTGYLKSNGATNDIVANKFTLTGQGGSTYTLTDTGNVEVTSGTSFTLTLSATDRNAVNLLLNQNGTSSTGGTTYNLAAAEDWAAGADPAVVVADLTGNGITTSNAVSAPGAPTIGTATAGDGQASVTFTAPGSNGGSAITTYTATASPGGAFGTCAGPAACTATVLGLTNGTAYSFTVTATNAIGTSIASGASNSVTPKAEQSITFTNPGAQNFGTTPTLTATSDSGLTVTFSSSTTGVCTVAGNVLTFVTAGACTIDADQAGNASTNAATTVTRSFTVNAIVPSAPTIGTATAGDTEASVTFTAPASTGGSAITGYTVTSNPGVITAGGNGFTTSPITVTGLTNGVSYTFTVTATNVAGTGSASGASISITPAAPQTITFNNPGAQNFGTSPTLTATSSAGGGYAVSFTTSTAGVCTITTGGVLTFVAAGSCTINADQAGDASYLAATQVSQTFAVDPVVPGAPTAAIATTGDTQASIAFTAPAFTGGATITGYTVTVSPADVAPVNGASSPIVVTGLTNGQAYTFTVTATNSAGTGSASAASNSITPAAAQTITFANPGAQNFGTAPTLTATADSGLTPVFTSATPAVCTITGGGALTFVSAGSCTIHANQPGNGSYLAATQVSQTFNVNAVTPGAPTIGIATAGEAEATVVFTAPGFTGGAAISGYTVTANPGGVSKAAPASPFTFTGLTNGTAYTFTVTATNSAGSGAASAASNAVTPAALNQAPLITQGESTSVTMSEDGTPTAFVLMLVATDADDDPLSWSITVTPANGTATVNAGNVSYTPTENYHGSDSFVVEVSDGEATDSINVNVTITPVNDAPTISGTPVTSLDQDTPYSFTPSAADVDGDDTLTFSITNKPGWANFDPATGALTGTPAGTDSGKTLGIVLSVNDGTASAALPAFDLEVISTIDPLQPIVTAPATLELNGTALYTPVTLRQLLGLAPTASQSEVEAALKALATDGVSGNNCCVTTVEGLNADNTLLLLPGRHEVSWKATNAVGVSGEAVQVVNIKPLVSLSPSQIAVRGSEVEFKVLLNGPSPVYPFSALYSINTAETTATAAEHNLANGTATFDQPGQMEVTISVLLTNVTGLNDSVLVVELAEGLNVGAANQHKIAIRQGNVPPVVSLSITQNGIKTSLITPTGGPVTVAASVLDANNSDTHAYDWSATSGLADTDGNQTDANRVFAATGLTGGHQLKVTVTDSAGASVQSTAYFRVIGSLPVLDDNTDTDGDGINDRLEGSGDSDFNGIPDFLDNMPSPNILPQQIITTNAYLIECDPGVRCGLGLFARGSTSGGVQLLDDELGQLDDLVVDPAFTPVGGVFDFTISDLPTPGQSVRVVIPQQAAIPANAVYRKFQQGRWVSFVEDANNAVHSAAGNPGYCPPPGAPEWTPGLTPGHLCVQLTIEDGGGNDDDGVVNAAVVDPGAVSVYFNTAPVAVNDTASTDDRTAIFVNVLSNDKDVDNDLLTVVAATAQQGTVSIEIDNKLKYTPKTGFSGTDVVSYRIRDSKGSEATASLSITITAYQNVVVESKSSGGSGSLAALLLLGVALLWRRRACSLMLLASIGFQVSAADLYLQLGAGQSTASAPHVSLPAGSTLSVDDTDTAYQVLGGYQIHDALALELGYHSLGDGSAVMSGSTLNVPGYQQLVLAATPVLGDGISAGIRWQFWRFADWQFELPVGVIRWQADIKSTVGGSTVTDERDGNDWYAGLAVNYQLSSGWGAGISYQHLDLAPGRVQQYLLTVRYRF